MFFSVEGNYYQKENNKFMTKLQDKRINCNLTQWQLALKTNIPIGTIQKYESGYTPIDGAKIKTLCIISKVLNCKIEDIKEDDETITLLKESRQ